MRREGIIHEASSITSSRFLAAAALVSPLTAFAQVVGSVTADQAAQPAPALAMPMLVALAIALIGFGAYSLRARSARTVAGFALVAGLSLLAGLSYANGSVVIEGADCNIANDSYVS